MLKRFFLSLSFFVFISAITSCDSDDIRGKVSNEHSGKFSLSLNSDPSFPTTKSTFNAADIKGYKIEILQGEEIIRTYLYADIPNELELNTGTYTVKASYGTLLPAAFDSLYVEGKRNFVIKSEEVTPVAVACVPINAKVMVDCTDAFSAVYKNYHMNMKTSHTKTPFEYTKTETRPVFFQVNTAGEKLFLDMKLYAAQLDTILSHSSSFALSPRDFVTIKLDVEEVENPDPDPEPDPEPEDPKSGATITVTINKNVILHEKLYEVVPIPGIFSIVSKNIPEELEQGAACKALVNILAKDKIAKCVMAINSETLDKTLDDSYDLANLKQGGIASLTAAGFLWDKDLKGQVMGTINFEKVVPQLQAGTHTFTFTLTDAKGQVSDSAYVVFTIVAPII